MKINHYVLLLAIATMFAIIWPSQPSLAQEELACETDMIVQEGDWLSTIAEQAYGDPTLYQAIAFATNLKAASDSSYATIDSHDVIEPGWKLCLPSQVEAEALEFVAPVDAGALTDDELANATYSGIYEEPITLTEGLYEGEPFTPDSASRPRVTLIPNGIVYGDLDGNGVDDAAVLLEENSGGSGTFTYVSAQLNQDGQPLDAGAVWVGDRTQVKSQAIENGQVLLEIITQGPDDPQCCASLKVGKTYALQDGLLAEVGSEDLGQISAADLNGTSWTLLELNFEQPVSPEPAITIEFQDGQISGSGGCNTYNGSFSLNEANLSALTIGPIASTRQACPEPIMTQETTYFSALGNVTQWGYVASQLALYYPTEGGLGRLLYAAPPPPTVAEPAVSQVEMLTATQVITYVPSEVPSETQAGSCFANAIGLGREDAWRCTVGNSIHDPCFAVEGSEMLVCDANPATAEAGFALELTEPLPPPDPGNLSNAWLVELADSMVCGLMTGTVVGVGDRIAPYGCPDGTYLFEDFQPGEVWMAEKAVIGLNDSGFFIEESEMVAISIIWY